jgi:hypothetical protein
MTDKYQYIIIETYQSQGELSRHSIRARPLPGQGLPLTMRVECSIFMRESHPIGTKFKVKAKVKSTDETPHIYTSWQWKYEVISDDDAREFIKGR